MLSTARSARRFLRPSFVPAEILEERVVPSSDAVIEWNNVALDAIRTDKTAPPVAARALAIIQASVYDAVNSITRDHQPYRVQIVTHPEASLDAAIAGAAYETLINLFPAQREAFDEALEAALALIPDGFAEDEGRTVGELVADRILNLRDDDGATDVVSYTPGTDPGDWQPTPRPDPNNPGNELPGLSSLLPQWPDVTPFAMTSGSQFRPDGLPDLDSSEYAEALAQVKDLGRFDSTVRTADQTQIALFWANGSGTATPPGHLNLMAQQASESEELSVEENARLFALLNIALADAAIVAWDAKYATNFWRPITAIREADSDGNALTEADPTWRPLITTPPFSTYVSGHATFSGAAAAVLQSFFGTDNIEFTLESENPAVQDRSFTSFSEAAAESAVSRLYGGIHFSFDNNDGLAAGRELGEYVATNLLAAVNGRAQAEVRDGALFVVGAERNEQITVTRSRNRFLVQSNRTTLGSFLIRDVEAICIDGRGGNDKLIIGGNITLRTLMYGGDGNDALYGGRGDDQLFGQEGKDSLFGGLGNDLLSGGAGRDLLNGGFGDDSLYGGSGFDILLGGTGNDFLDRDGDHDRLVQ